VVVGIAVVGTVVVGTVVGTVRVVATDPAPLGSWTEFEQETVSSAPTVSVNGHAVGLVERAITDDLGRRGGRPGGTRGMPADYGRSGARQRRKEGS
jgi:hypothetical protein